MFVERNVCYSALFTYLVRWHTHAVSLTLSDIILAQLACPLSDIMLCLHSGITNLQILTELLFAKSHHCSIISWAKIKMVIELYLRKGLSNK
jgi:hypothetical protein